MTILKMHSILHIDAGETVIAILLLNIGSLVGDFNHLENISQWEGLSHILWKIKHV